MGLAWADWAEMARQWWDASTYNHILLVPVIIFFSIQVPIWLETKGTPTRHFVLVDQSGTLAPVIESRVDDCISDRCYPR